MRCRTRGGNPGKRDRRDAAAQRVSWRSGSVTGTSRVRMMHGYLTTEDKEDTEGFGERGGLAAVCFCCGLDFARDFLCCHSGATADEII